MANRIHRIVYGNGLTFVPVCAGGIVGGKQYGGCRRFVKADDGVPGLLGLNANCRKCGRTKMALA